MLQVLSLAFLVTIVSAQGPKPGSAAAGEQCTADGSKYTYSETVDTSKGTRTITTSYCPNHAYKNLNPNYPVSSGDKTYVVPLKPMYTPTAGSQVDLSAQGGSEF